jgi:hypothetical protein
MSIPIIGQQKQPAEMVEVCRSYAYKLNLQNHGGPAYESCDFFSSRKIQCAPEDAGWVSQQIFEECVAEVRASVIAVITEMNRKKAARNAESQRRTA